MKQDKAAPGVYITLRELISLQYQASGYSFLPRQPIHSLLSGRHSSRLRGRGLDFEELRQYRLGDDIRAMDWKATKRYRQPFIRVYNEERERPVLLIIDQRVSMFFGSRVEMKSVTAAKCAALGAWRVVSAGDRVGAMIFNDSKIVEFKPRRSKKTVMQIMGEVVRQNNALSVEIENCNKDMLDEVLAKAARVAGHDYLIAVISDFYGLGSNTIRLVKRLCRHNDVMLLPIYDPITQELPENSNMVLSDGHKQVLIDSSSKQLRRRFPEIFKGRLRTLSTSLAKFGVPVLPIHTVEDVSKQVRRALGYVPGKPLPTPHAMPGGAR